MGCKHHVHPFESRLDVFGRRAGLVFAVCRQLGTDQTLEIPFVLSAVDKALEVATPQIWNSDQGCHFTSPQYVERLLERGVRISMDGKGRALDNVFVERLWRSVKYEEVYLHEYDTPKEARQGMNRYLTLYNNERLHQSLKYKPPAEVYWRRTIL